MIDFFAVIFASLAVMRLWFYGSILAGVRAKIESSADSTLIKRLLMCPFCLSYYPPFLFYVVFILPSYMLYEPWNIICKLPVYILACQPFVERIFLLLRPESGNN